MGVNWDRPRTLDEMREGYSHERARRRMIALLIASVCVVLVIGVVWLLLPSAPDTKPTGAISPPAPRLSALPPEQPQIQRPAPVVPEPEARDSAPAKPETPPQSAVQQTDIPPQEQQELQARVAVMIRQGDIAGARVILARLDRAGNRHATFTLAETYDPALLAQWNVRGIRPDPDKAADLYQRAADGGISAARDRLNALAATQR